MFNPGSWEQKCSERAQVSIDADLNRKAQIEVDRVKFLQRFENRSVAIVSDVIYADELSDIGGINFNSNRAQPALFFEVYTKDNKVRYRSARSDTELFDRYPNIKSIRQISKDSYDELRAKAVRINEDNL